MGPGDQQRFSARQVAEGLGEKKWHIVDGVKRIIQVPSFS
jgi:hypothetical protein